MTQHSVHDTIWHTIHGKLLRQFLRFLQMPQMYWCILHRVQEKSKPKYFCHIFWTILVRSVCGISLLN